MPVTGKVLEFNPAINENEGNDPTLINSDPYGDGWIIKIELTDLSQLEDLLDASAYKALNLGGGVHHLDSVDDYLCILTSIAIDGKYELDGFT
jgi:hypothetical protein